MKKKIKYIICFLPLLLLFVISFLFSFKNKKINLLNDLKETFNSRIKEQEQILEQEKRQQERKKIIEEIVISKKKIKELENKLEKKKNENKKIFNPDRVIDNIRKFIES